MPRLVYLLVVTSTFMVHAQNNNNSNNNNNHYRPQSNQPSVWIKKKWSQFSNQEHSRWRSLYESRPNPYQTAPWDYLTDEEKENFAWKLSRPSRAELGARRRALKEKLIAMGRYNPEVGDLVFNNPFEPLRWSIAASNQEWNEESRESSLNEDEEIRRRATVLKREKESREMLQKEAELQRLKALRDLREQEKEAWEKRKEMEDEDEDEEEEDKEDNEEEEDDEEEDYFPSQVRTELPTEELLVDIPGRIVKEILKTPINFKLPELHKLPLLDMVIKPPPPTLKGRAAFGAGNPAAANLGTTAMEVGVTLLEAVDTAIVLLDNLPFEIQLTELTSALEEVHDVIDFALDILDNLMN